jgi:hypothetical protein
MVFSSPGYSLPVILLYQDLRKRDRMHRIFWIKPIHMPENILLILYILLEIAVVLEKLQGEDWISSLDGDYRPEKKTAITGDLW